MIRGLSVDILNAKVMAKVNTKVGLKVGMKVPNMGQKDKKLMKTKINNLLSAITLSMFYWSF